MSKKGLKLLKLKRSALILEFFNLSKKVASLRSGLQSKLILGYDGIHASEMFVGPLKLEYESMRIPKIQGADSEIEKRDGCSYSRSHCSKLWASWSGILA